ncbi:patatin-like phospholipase family protein [Chryseobacterium vrystaatense]|uniref:PNPLA domain-containing protein n=1 Tax=Chryseobacterium vrystaatense TaxID=307480 RepID=A0ABR4UNF8_9FLAO|nr:patatin-like phospholipase family protein [Chryseobacterium vrystaatense]KFF26535.1 hypothetical protein IW16_11845 [Chryseobacterium vrystaatense]
METDLETIKSKFGKKDFGDGKGTVAQRLKNLENTRFSDTISKDKKDKILQWVNFVQEGGGTLGISLVGYVFVLEYLGIRFLRLAGTSAGAINTLFLASMGEKDEPKSAELFKMMMDNKRFKMSSFVDAELGIVRFMVLSLSKGPGIISNILISYLAVAALALIILPLLSLIGVEMKVGYLIFMAIFAIMSAILGVLLWRLHRYRYGINPGNVFEQFLVKELKDFGIVSQEDLKARAQGSMKFSSKKFVNTVQGQVVPKSDFVAVNSMKSSSENSGEIIFAEDPLRNTEKAVTDKENSWYAHIVSQMDNNADTFEMSDMTKSSVENNSQLPTLYLIRDEEDPEKELEDQNDSEEALGTEKDKKLKKKASEEIHFDYSFVTTDIANQCKIVFPYDEHLYDFGSESPNPASFVRASMAIPLFFEPKILSVNKNTDWMKAKGLATKATEGILIDGGSLSNFPINLFHLDHIKQPRVPIMGARIMDQEPAFNQKVNLTFSSYVGNVINTLRNNEDSAFLAINPFYKKHCIAEINAYETNVNWLNFGLSPDQKEKLFLKGVEAALNFLETFDWKQYKADRADLKQIKLENS